MKEKIKTVKSFDPKNPTVLTVIWADGNETAYDFAAMPDEIKTQLAYHGFKQKSMDAHANGTSEYGSVAGCRERTEQVIAQMMNGTWSEGGNRISWVIEAMAETYDVSIEAAKTAYEKLSEKKQKSLAKHPELVKWKLERDRARLENVEPTEDLGQLFK